MKSPSFYMTSRYLIIFRIYNCKCDTILLACSKSRFEQRCEWRNKKTHCQLYFRPIRHTTDFGESHWYDPQWILVGFSPTIRCLQAKPVYPVMIVDRSLIDPLWLPLDISCCFRFQTNFTPLYDPTQLFPFATFGTSFVSNLILVAHFVSQFNSSFTPTL
jgi:hypothetical protein